MFHRDPKTSKAAPAKAPKDLTRMLSPDALLADDKRQVLLNSMRELTALESERYDNLCKTLTTTLVAYAQQLPEASNSHYSQPGGVVDYALNRTEAALELLRGFLVLKDGQTLSEEQKLWQYALYSAALLQGIGKLFVDYQIHQFDTNAQMLALWNPLLEPLNARGAFYDLAYTKEPQQDFRRRLNLLMAKAMMPAAGFAWIASNPKVLEVWLALLHEDTRSAGTLGAILDRANALAIARYFNEWMIRTHGRGGRHIPGSPFSVGVPASLTDKEQAIGIEFINWLREGLEAGRIMINKAPLFMVPGGLLMSQEMFQWFVREHPDYKNWMAIQKGFLSLGLHEATPEGEVTGRFEDSISKQIQSGVVFKDFGVALPESMSVVHGSNQKEASLTAIEVTHLAQYPGQFSQQLEAMAIDPLHQLTASGQWESMNQEFFTYTHGAPGGV